MNVDSKLQRRHRRCQDAVHSANYHSSERAVDTRASILSITVEVRLLAMAIFVNHGSGVPRCRYLDDFRR